MTGQDFEVPSFDPIDAVDVDGLRVTVLRTALDLDVFTAVARGARDIRTLAVSVACSERGTAVLVRALLALGWLEGSVDAFDPSPTAAAYLSGDGLGDTRAIYRTWFGNRDRFADAIRSGEPVARHDLDAAEADWRAFAAPDLVRWPHLAPELASILAERRVSVPPGGRVLDLGCGSAIASLSLVREVAGAEVLAVDRAEVVEVAQELAAAMGLSDRLSTVVGEADSIDVGAGDFDVVLLINVAQYLDDERFATVLRMARAALRPGGSAYIVCAVESDGRDPMAWATEVEMFLASAVEQRPPDRILAMIEDAGFATVRTFPPNRFVATT